MSRFFHFSTNSLSFLSSIFPSSFLSLVTWVLIGVARTGWRICSTHWWQRRVACPMITMDLQYTRRSCHERKDDLFPSPLSICHASLPAPTPSLHPFLSSFLLFIHTQGNASYTSLPLLSIPFFILFLIFSPSLSLSCASLHALNPPVSPFPLLFLHPSPLRSSTRDSIPEDKMVLELNPK